MELKDIFKKRPSGFMLITVGLVFFLNPMIALFDILPDFIGCALIMYALNKLSPIAADFENAFGYFKYMLFTSAARTAVAFASSSFDGVTLLSVSLILALIETGIAVMALGSLCEGISVLNLRYRPSAPEPTDLKTVGIAFFAARGFSSMLPYVTSVFTSDDSIITGETYAPADYSALLLLVNVVITVIFAVFFMTAVVTHIVRAAKNSEYTEAIENELSDKQKNDPELFVRKNMTFALSILAYSSLFLIDFIGGLPVGGRNFIPDAGFGVLAVWAVLILGKYLEGAKKTAIYGAVYTVASTVSFFVYDSFLSKHYYTDFDLLIMKFAKQYVIAIVFAVIETVALILFAIQLVKYLMPIATHYAIQDVPPEFVRLTVQTEKMRKNSALLLKLFGIFLGVIAVLGTALVASLQIFDVNYGDVNFPYILTHLALNIIFYAFASTVFLRMRAGVVKRYERPSDIL